MNWCWGVAGAWRLWIHALPGFQSWLGLGVVAAALAVPWCGGSSAKHRSGCLGGGQQLAFGAGIGFLLHLSGADGLGAGGQCECRRRVGTQQLQLAQHSVAANPRPAARGSWLAPRSASSPVPRPRSLGQQCRCCSRLHRLPQGVAALQSSDYDQPLHRPRGPTPAPGSSHRPRGPTPAPGSSHRPQGPHTGPRVLTPAPGSSYRPQGPHTSPRVLTSPCAARPPSRPRCSPGGPATPPGCTGPAARQRTAPPAPAGGARARGARRGRSGGGGQQPGSCAVLPLVRHHPGGRQPGSNQCASLPWVLSVSATHLVRMAHAGQLPAVAGRAPAAARLPSQQRLPLGHGRRRLPGCHVSPQGRPAGGGGGGGGGGWGAGGEGDGGGEAAGHVRQRAHSTAPWQQHDSSANRCSRNAPGRVRQLARGRQGGCIHRPLARLRCCPLWRGASSSSGILLRWQLAPALPALLWLPALLVRPLLGCLALAGQGGQLPRSCAPAGPTLPLLPCRPLARPLLQLLSAVHGPADSSQARPVAEPCSGHTWGGWVGGWAGGG